MFHTIYQGDISTRTGVLFRVFIQQERETAPDAVGELRFSYDEPLVIEREEQELYEPVITTTATLRVISPADRTFVHLYTVRAASVRLIVHRQNSNGNWVQYYAGTLDTESYEEPYAYDSDYIVELTFSDFGVLKRLKYNLSGFVSLSEIIQTALQAAALPTEELMMVNATDTTFTYEEELYALTAENVVVSSENFYDEDNEPMTLYDALEGILQPLAWRIVAESTSVRVFDLHRQYNQPLQPLPVRWFSDDQQLSVSSVYNDVVITWSPYVNTGTDDDQKAFPHKVDPNVNALGEMSGLRLDDGTLCISHSLKNDYEYIDIEENSDEKRGFNIFINKEGTGATIPYDSAASFFKITPQGNGEEAEGIAFRYLVYDLNNYQIGEEVNCEITDENKVAFTSRKIHIPPLSPEDKKNIVIRVTVPALIDYRPNPFAEPGELDKSIETKWKQYASFIYVPVVITFQSADGMEYYYKNLYLNVLRPVQSPVTILDYSLSKWESLYGTYSYLSYYQTNERESQPAINGSFTDNRHSINPHTEILSSSLENADSGEYISLDTLPDEAVKYGGTISLQVISNKWLICKAGNTENKIGEFEYFYRWVLFKLPTVEFRKRQTYDSEFPTDDIETRTVVNTDAEESLEIDVIFGSLAEDPLPTARGNVYFRREIDGKDVFCRMDTITRAGQTGTFQQLLAATIYSQYAEPHIRLSGTCESFGSFYRLYTDASSPDITLVPISSYEDVRAQTAEVTFAQLCPENYQKA